MTFRYATLVRYRVQFVRYSARLPTVNISDCSRSEISQVWWWLRHTRSTAARRLFPQTTKLNHSATGRASVITAEIQTDWETATHTYAHADTINASKTVPRRQQYCHCVWCRLKYVALHRSLLFDRFYTASASWPSEKNAAILRRSHALKLHR